MKLMKRTIKAIVVSLAMACMGMKTVVEWKAPPNNEPYFPPPEGYVVYYNGEAEATTETSYTVNTESGQTLEIKVASFAGVYESNPYVFKVVVPSIPDYKFHVKVGGRSPYVRFNTVPLQGWNTTYTLYWSQDLNTEWKIWDTYEADNSNIEVSINDVIGQDDRWPVFFRVGLRFRRDI